MNYVLQLSQEQMIGWKSRIAQHTLAGKGFMIEEADNGLIVQPVEISDDNDEDLTPEALQERITKAPLVEKDEDGTIYYEDEKGNGVYFPE
jgi:hypothetical protein